ncbi:MAG: methyl-accepting chemotaxis protein [Lachnospiraceae bacterium]|nr:methyl-accepting chemotaxis protein [Lachnospiraceae bacterium]
MNNSDIALVNKRACSVYTIITSLLSVAYLIQAIKGATKLPVFAVLIVLGLGPMIACWVVYKSNAEAAQIKHIMGIGYSLFYIFSCFTSNERLVFVYAIPMMIAITMFCDLKYSVAISIGASLVSCVHAVLYTLKHPETMDVEIAASEIEILVMIVIALFTTITIKTIIYLNDQKVKNINETNEKTEKMLDDIMNISGDIIDEVSIVSTKMNLIVSSCNETVNAMQEIQSGTNDSAESVQNQLVKTEEIQTQIGNVTKASDSIGNNVKITVDACHEGRDNIEKLIEQSRVSEEAGAAAVKEVEDLKSSTEQMQTIVELIQNVASQTSLLALNASIEAARAGEAGRGFAVVATEISNLASQTQSATKNISDLIAGIAGEMTEVVSAIDSLVDSNRIQNESANVTAGSFEKIVESIRNIRTNSGELNDVVTKLASANQEIVESIQTISAITEEVSAHSNTTGEVTEQNAVIVNETLEIVNEMSENAEKLKAIK